jgi:RsiW-degrading membrane proteinase PrsW (M82 family)
VYGAAMVAAPASQPRADESGQPEDDQAAESLETLRRAALTATNRFLLFAAVAAAGVLLYATFYDDDTTQAEPGGTLAAIGFYGAILAAALAVAALFLAMSRWSRYSAAKRSSSAPR